MKRIYVILLLLFAAFNLSFAQTTKVTGVVTDEVGDPLIGAFVAVKGSKVACTTDLDGKYSINAPAQGQSYVLVFQYLGMVSQEIPVNSACVLDVVLKGDNRLEEAVIIGAYGTKQSREDLVGSAFQVNSETLKDKPKTRVDDLLTGMVPGLSINSNTDSAGSPRTRYETRIRGEASLSASNEPLWVIDGIPQYTGNNTGTMPGMSYTVSPLSYLDPSDIESITVLKDADQVSIYGANGANGVILVTTKSGSLKTPLKVDVSLRMGVSAPDYTTMFKMMNAEQYMIVAKEAWTNAGYSMSDFPYQDNDYNTYSTTSTDWPRLYLGLGTDIYAQVGLNAGSDRVASSASASYYRKDNVIQSDNQQRFSVRLKEDFQIAKKCRLGISLLGNYNVNNLFPLGNQYLDTLPIFSPYENDGHTFRLYNKIWDESKGDWVKKKFHDNEIPNRELNDNTQRSANMKAVIDFNWEIYKGLSISCTAGVNFLSSHEDVYYSRETLDGMDEDRKIGSSSKKDASYLSFTNSDVIKYNGKFGKHNVSVYAGLELNSQSNKYTSISGSGFANDHIKELTYANTISSYSYTSISESRSMSYFARAQYSYDQRYYISANFRRDGNSVFGQYSRWATFWSVGASWNIHKEPFFHADIVKMLKLKASIGSAGNSRLDGSVATGTYNFSDSYSYMGEAGATLGTMPNPGLSWETTIQANLGVRLELKDIIDVELEYYNYNTRDLLSKIYVSRTISDDRLYANVGGIRNQGIEFSLTSHNFHRRNFTWNTTLNGAHNDNKITKLYNGVTTSFGETVWKEGFSTNTWCLIRWAGVDPANGKPLFYDKDGNLTDIYSYDNRVAGKTTVPALFGGMTNDFYFYGVNVSLQMNYELGGYALATYARNFMADGYDIIGGNQAVEVFYYRWTKPGQQSLFPKVSQVTQHSTSYNDRFLYKKTNFQISNLTVGYSFPVKWVEKMRMQSFNVSFICDNVFLFTPGMSRKFNSYKTAKSGYPLTRTFSLGINARF